MSILWPTVVSSLFLPPRPPWALAGDQSWPRQRRLGPGCWPVDLVTVETTAARSGRQRVDVDRLRRGIDTDAERTSDVYRCAERGSVETACRTNGDRRASERRCTWGCTRVNVRRNRNRATRRTRPEIEAGNCQRTSVWHNVAVLIIAKVCGLWAASWVQLRANNR